MLATRRIHGQSVNRERRQDEHDAIAGPVWREEIVDQDLCHKNSQNITNGSVAC